MAVRNDLVSVEAVTTVVLTGAMFTSRHLTSDGMERTFALNHLAPFLLTGALARPARGLARHGGAAGQRSAFGCLAAGVLDVDHFTSVNDEYSHEVGDEVLRVLARLFRRVGDLRPGGESGMVRTPGSSPGSAVRSSCSCDPGLDGRRSRSSG